MERTSTILALVGKGGVGKTSLSALTVRLLAEAYPNKRILAIDADPAVGLATALGVEAGSTVDDIRKAILSQVDRGCTMLHGQGGYLGRETEVIMSVISNHELPKIERLARNIDPECFMIVSQVTEVWGRGFSTSKHQPPASKRE